MAKKKGYVVYGGCNPHRGAKSETQARPSAELRLAAGTKVSRWKCCRLKHSRAPQLIDSCAVAPAQAVEQHEGG